MCNCYGLSNVLENKFKIFTYLGNIIVGYYFLSIYNSYPPSKLLRIWPNCGAQTLRRPIFLTNIINNLDAYIFM